MRNSKTLKECPRKVLNTRLTPIQNVVHYINAPHNDEINI